MVWAAITITEKTSLVIMTRDPDAVRNGYTAWSYIWALEEGLLPIYKPGDAFQQDNARIHTAKSTQECWKITGFGLLNGLHTRLI